MKSATLNIEEQPTVDVPRTGQVLDIRGTPFTAGATISAGAVIDEWSSVNIQAPTVGALSADVTYPSAATFRVEGPPTGAGVAAADACSIRVMSGPVRIEEEGESALTIRGGVQSKTVRVSTGLQLGQTTIAPSPAGGGKYDLTLPADGPTDGSVISSSSAGQLSFTNFNQLQSAFTSAWVGQQVANNLTFWTDVAYSVGGKANFSPVKANGEPIFANIILASASSMEETDELTAMPMVSLRSISTDGRTVVFNVLTGATSVVGSCTLQHAPEGTRVNAFVVGVATAV